MAPGGVGTIKDSSGSVLDFEVKRAANPRLRFPSHCLEFRRVPQKAAHSYRCLPLVARNPRGPGFDLARVRAKEVPVCADDVRQPRDGCPIADSEPAGRATVGREGARWPDCGTSCGTGGRAG